MKSLRIIQLLFLCLTLALFATFLGCSPSEERDPEAQPFVPDRVFRLQMATFWPSTDFQVVEGHMKWIEEIEKRTDGRVQISLHAGEALLGAREIYEGVVTGVADIGTTCPAYTPGIFPLTAAFELPGHNNDNALVASLTIDEGYKRIREELGIDEYEDVKVLFFWATGPGDVITREPVHSLEDLAGKTIRTVGGTVPTMEILGATPVSMPMSESYLALEQRIVEGILAPTDVLRGFRLAEVINYVTETPFLYNIVFMKVMNLDTWNALPPDIQLIFEEVSKEFAFSYGVLREIFRLDGLRYGIQNNNIEVITLSEEEEARWRQRISPIVDSWIEKTQATGLPGSDVFEIVKELDEKFSAEYGDYEFMDFTE